MVGFHAYADVTSTKKTLLDVSIPCKPMEVEFVDLYLVQQTPTVLGEGHQRRRARTEHFSRSHDDNMGSCYGWHGGGVDGGLRIRQ